MKRLLALFLISPLCAGAAEAQRTIGFADYAIPDRGALAVPALSNEDGEVSIDGVLADVDARTGGRLAAALAEAAFSGADEATLTLYGLEPFSRIDVIGLGQGPVDRLAAEDFGGLAARVNDGSRGGTLQLLWNETGPDAGADRVAFGFRLGDYRFDRYQSDRQDPETGGDVVILGPESGAEARFEDDLAHLADAITLARDLASEPANVLYPDSFVARIREAFDGVDDVRIKVLDEEDLARLGMGAHLGVGSGSSRPPRLLAIEYDGGGREAPLVLAGKGITFDTGGISLKPGDDMWHMKTDMSVAAVVGATVLAAAKRGAGGAGGEHAVGHGNPAR